MFTVQVEEREMGVKPMNCPGHAHLFSTQRHSYRDLPVRYFEPGLCTATRPRACCTGCCGCATSRRTTGTSSAPRSRSRRRCRAAWRWRSTPTALFDFDVSLELSTRPEQRIGTDEMWDRAERKLTDTLEELGLDYELNPGDGAFYGPKIDMHMTDSLGRSWQLGTVQLDYSMPERFELTYTGADNQEHRPVMIHRAMFGSYERFIGIMIEHYAGELPLWLAPVQAIVLPVSDRFNDYGRQVRDTLRGGEARVELDDRSESIGRKIRDAELRKIPYMLVVGEREEEERTVSVREHRGGDAGACTVAQFAERLHGELYSLALQPRKSSERHA